MKITVKGLFDESFPRISKQASPDRCQRCGSMIWKAICWTGFATKLDPEPLDVAADLVAYLHRRPTYRVWRSPAGGHFEINYRTAGDIKTDDYTGIVLAAHRCDFANIRTHLPNYWPSHQFLPPTTEEPPF